MDDKAILNRQSGYECYALIYRSQIVRRATLHAAMLGLLSLTVVVIRMDFKRGKEKAQQEKKRD